MGRRLVPAAPRLGVRTDPTGCPPQASPARAACGAGAHTTILQIFVPSVCSIQFQNLHRASPPRCIPAKRPVPNSSAHMHHHEPLGPSSTTTSTTLVPGRQVQVVTGWSTLACLLALGIPTMFPAARPPGPRKRVCRWQLAEHIAFRTREAGRA